MSVRESLVILGCSGNMMEMFEHLDASFRIAAILDDNPDLAGQLFEGVPVRPMSALAEFPEARVSLMIGSQRSVGMRAGLLQRLGVARERCPTVIHPRAHVSRFAMLGAGTVLFPGVVVTSNAVIGDHVMILPGSVIHHDVTVGDHTLIGSGVTVAGHVRIGSACYVGSAASFRNGAEVGDGAVVGMAANVLGAVAPGAVVAGNPARPLR